MSEEITKKRSLEDADQEHDTKRLKEEGDEEIKDGGDDRFAYLKAILKKDKAGNP